MSAGTLTEPQQTLLMILVFGNKSRYLCVSGYGFVDGYWLLDRTVDFCNCILILIALARSPLNLKATSRN